MEKILLQISLELFLLLHLKQVSTEADPLYLQSEFDTVSGAVMVCECPTSARCSTSCGIHAVCLIFCLLQELLASRKTAAPSQTFIFQAPNEAAESPVAGR